MPDTRFVPELDQGTETSAQLILRDGSTAQIRGATPADRTSLIAFFQQLSAELRSHRFIFPFALEAGLAPRSSAEHETREALTLVVTRLRDGEPRVVAAGSYSARDARTAEVVLGVADGFRSTGLRYLLLERLALAAVRNGFTHFQALAGAANEPMIEVLRESGFAITAQGDQGELEIDLSLAPTAASVERHETRDRVAAVASLSPFFRPHSVAVVGASRDPAAIGHRVLTGLLRAGFRGLVDPVNPKATDVAWVRAHPTVRDLPGPVDLAVIAVPAGAVLSVVDDCGACERSL